ncbi:LacI family DNA-binding transcriptional regulator [Ramlibacter henchirensis]|uniref:LacI family DNA-binding transcriptional regulator n=1 Tax=Ramlibacter henchirensis TaxID=204072 RepID=A0A4Z0C2M8_9BURK|nr:LacI family DNA-binding transcriptional regulator [Ramlibacter henchirensis]TFZ05451.1 LacI family DNA-binding transcriptional regulator [Ramlibacter henchirensis]
MTRAAALKRPTLHDVAREAGVSLITASRALSNPGVLSEKTLERVLQAVQDTGYIPNLLAGGLKSQRSMTIAGLVPIISVPQFLPTIRTLTETLDAAGYQLFLGQSGYDYSREERLIDTMLARRPDGIVVAGLVRSEQARDRLRRLGVPVVETWDLSDRPIDVVVGFSHLKVGSAVAGYFLSKGWDRVGIATGDDQRAMQRLEGFLAAFGRDVPTVKVPAPSNLAVGRRALAELLQKDPDIQAIYCSSDGFAQGVLVEAAHRGLRVPEDLAVCGFGDADFAAHLLPSLTTVHVDGAEIGRRAAQLMLDRCKGIAIEHPIVDLGFRIVERESTGKRTLPTN